MIISLNWINEFVDLKDIPVEELIKRFGLATAEVEGVEYKGKDIDNVVVAKILTVEDHPNSNHLHILTVDDGTGAPVQVVCGAPNVRVGLKTFFARVGANVCGFKIQPAKLVGVESNGMCCGGNELGIEQDTSGIVELDDSFIVGTNIKDILPVEDVLIEVDNKSLTNRPDLWGHYGIAREFSAIFNRPLKKMEVEDLSKYSNLKPLDIKVETENCYRYAGITVKNVLSHKSSALIKLRLNYCNMRDINLLADMTNYLMLEMGQPMHAFDNKIVNGIRVIETNKPISMLTLENEEHIIEANSLVIADNNYEPVALAGIKGGLKSGISTDTTSLLLESACFNSMAIRKTSRKIGLITDASLRYEKSLDPEMCDKAIARFVYLLKKDYPNVEVSSCLTDVYNYHYPKHKIEVSTDFLCRRGGVNLEKETIINTLRNLEFEIEDNGNNLIVSVPSFRATKDVSIKEDLVEEVFRMYGYDNIKSAPLSMPLQPVEQLDIHSLEYKIKFALASKFGLNEVHSYIWNYKDYNAEISINQESFVSLVDSSNSGQSGIRSILTPTLIKIADENKNKYSSIQIFEIGRVVSGLTDEKIAIERKKLSIVIADEEKSERELYFKLKDITNYIFNQILSVQVDFDLNAEKSKIFHPVNSCLIKSGDIIVGEMGVLYPTISKAVDKRKKFVALEFDLENMLRLSKQNFVLTPTSKFQSVSLDFNFVADKNMSYGEIDKILEQFRASYIMERSLKDVYKNDELLNGKISYTINYIITPKDKTLEASDIEKFSARLIQHMNRFNIELRV